jgi:hypothetical protein
LNSKHNFIIATIVISNMKKLYFPAQTIKLFFSKAVF